MNAKKLSIALLAALMIVCLGAISVFAAVARIGGTEYDTLEAAVAAAENDSFIEVLADCSGNGIVVPQDKFTYGLIIDFNGHTYDVTGTLVGSRGTETLGFQLLKGNYITFVNGTITSSNPDCKMLIQNYSNLFLGNMIIDANHSNILYAVSNNNGSSQFQDSQIIASEGNVAFDVWYGMSTAYPSVSVAVYNCDVTGDVEFGAAKNANMENIAENMGLYIASNSTVSGDLVNSSNAAKAEAVAAAATEIIAIQEGCELAGDNDFDPTVAVIGNAKYNSLEDAIAAANDGDTIVVKKNSAGNGIKFPQGKFQPTGVTVDFNGRTYDVTGTLVGSTGTETLGFQLLKDNTITFKNGTVTSSNPGCKMLIQNYSNLTLDNMLIDGTADQIQYAVSNNNGETLIKDSTINASENGVAFDVWFGMFNVYPSVAVTVENSTINGDVEFGASSRANADAIPTNMSLTINDSEIHGDIVNSSSASMAAAVEAATAETIVIEDSVIDGGNAFDVSKTLVVFNMEKVDDQTQIAVFAGVDALEYECAGFEINGEVYTTRWVSTAVSVNGDVYEAAAFGDGAQYVFGQIVTVPDDEVITIRAFVTDFAGNTTYNKTVVLGDAYTLTTIEGTGQGASGFQPGPSIPGLDG